jgi:hypothetical protein
MIRLKRDNLVMEVCTEVQASVFERNGYVRVKPEPKPVETVIVNEPKPQEPEQPEEQPKRRRRKAKAEEAVEPVTEASEG